MRIEQTVKVKCRKCGEEGFFAMGEERLESVEAAQEFFDSHRLPIMHCAFGHHMEMSPIDYDVLALEDQEVLTDEEWLEVQREKYDLWTTDELDAAGIKITSFSYGVPFAEVKGKDFPLNFITSPEGKRYYTATKGRLEEAKA